MRTSIALSALIGLGFAQNVEFFRFTSPSANAAANIYRRQTPPPGYSPEFGSCGTGANCTDACGPNWITCKASTDLSLFCYNEVDLGQTCCENGSGRACDAGYYCAWQEFNGRVWCCENGQSLEECGVPTDKPVTTSNPTSTSSLAGESSSTASSTSGGVVSSQTGGPTSDFTDPSSTGQCPPPTVTSWATATVTSTITYAAITVTVLGDGCSGNPAASESQPGFSESGSIITSPPSTFTATPWPPSNTSFTSTLFTADAGGIRPELWLLSTLLVLPLL
ncbi:uncharacterized protein CTHT_0032150 [Thermochaetoides thermophila DSM 1495]|uniref:Uncharacterized protein n=1 Tax=Chaetomium thermophilum (strain DSM 1495 / CBS 144.50 / IMI 039719) TaxID=759272 RepID=G0S4Y9_CHATD|nr:hypothetical protein CTHT_0032150 [Thermochaetoides thermophila DSM 1495]EGS21360.1 hypothetical protein CTHT_0032150 [Thermochaetoides thermophila DSM 1495]